MKRSCPICSTTSSNFLFTQHFNNHDVTIVNNYDVVSCRKCGFVYANRIPSQKAFNAYYKEMSKYEYKDNHGLVPEDNINYFKKVYDFIRPYLKSHNSSIMDVGCSTGGLLSIFKSNGYLNISGIDPSSYCVDAALTLYDIKVSKGNISDIDISSKYDLVILSSVLEHIIDVNKSIDKLYSTLNDNGYLFISVPNIKLFDKYITAPFQQFSIEHINYFSLESILNLLSYFNMKLITYKDINNKMHRNVDPDVFILVQKCDNNSIVFKKDCYSEIAAFNYIKVSSKIDTSLKYMIKEIISRHDKIIVWGVGTHTQRLLGCGLNLSSILYFVDSNERYTGKLLKGKMIKLPADIKEDTVPILISTYSFQDEIINQIKSLKLNNAVIKLYT